MALFVILILYLSIGFLSATGSVFLAKRIFSKRAEQTFFALFLLPIAGFYLAFTAYFGDEGAWGFETGGVIAFTVLGLLGVRVPVALILGYFLHGLWDVLHEMQLHGVDVFGFQRATEVPLAYGAFCAAYDWFIAAYFYIRRGEGSVGSVTPRSS
jgi:hypothetical protein